MKQTRSLNYASVYFEVETKNELPDWTQTLLLTHDITVTINKEGKLDETPFYTYSSPKLKDPEGHKTSIMIQTSEDMSSWLTFLVATSADQFTFTVNRNKFSAPGQKTITLLYGD